MTLYKVVGKIDQNNKIYHMVLPYSFIGTLHTYFSHNFGYTMGGGYGLKIRMKEFLSFMDMCFLSETKAKKIAIHLDNCKDIDY